MKRKFMNVYTRRVWPNINDCWPRARNYRWKHLVEREWMKTPISMPKSSQANRCIKQNNNLRTWTQTNPNLMIFDLITSSILYYKFDGNVCSEFDVRYLFRFSFFLFYFRFLFIYNCAGFFFILLVF